MIDQINDSVKTSKGNVVVVEKGMKLTYDIAPAARLIDLDEYKVSGGEMLYGFVAGLLASNYDITDLYIDGILKVLNHDINRLGVVLDEMAAEYDSIRIGKINVDEEQALAIKFGVSSIPTLILFKDGQIDKRLVGLRTKEHLAAELGL